MLALLKQNKEFVFQKISRHMFNLYEDILLISLLKLNQHQNCYDVENKIINAFSVLTGRTIVSIKARIARYKYLKFSDFWKILKHDQDVVMSYLKCPDI